MYNLIAGTFTFIAQKLAFKFTSKIFKFIYTRTQPCHKRFPFHVSFIVETTYRITYQSNDAARSNCAL